MFFISYFYCYFEQINFCRQNFVFELCSVCLKFHLNDISVILSLFNIEMNKVITILILQKLHNQIVSILC